jgi:hypothetical protein
MLARLPDEDKEKSDGQNNEDDLQAFSDHHGIGFWRIQYLEQELGASGVRLLKSIKNAVDPEGILNRGKLIDGGR